MFKTVVVPIEAPLMALRNYAIRKVLTMGQAIHCQKNEIAGVTEKWSHKSRVMA